MRHLTTAWQHIRRTPYQALAAVLVMSLTFFISSIFIFIALGSQVILHFFETRPQVTAFFKDEFKAAQVEILKEKISASGKIAQMKYVSKEEALAIYREQNKDDPLLLEMVTAHILPASLEVSTTNLESLKEVAQILGEEPGVEEVIFQEDVVLALSTWTRALRIVGGGLVAFLLVVCFLTVLVIIGMKIALRKEEIEILRLIGASPWYIRAPFIFEGIFYGLAGATIGWVGSYLVLLYATPFLLSFLAGIPLLPVSLLLLFGLLLGLLLGGVTIGVLGSLVALRRYLK